MAGHDGFPKGNVSLSMFDRAALNLAPGGTHNDGGERRQIRLPDLVWNMGAG
jgi:hypothetical protein